MLVDAALGVLQRYVSWIDIELVIGGNVCVCVKTVNYEAKLDATLVCAVVDGTAATCIASMCGV
jgi:hypothetical protein